MNTNPHLYAVIMAGGKGTRFWPLSREHRPKQLLSIAESRPMLRATMDRILPLIPHERILVVTGASHARDVEALLPDLATENIIAEPVGRNTAPCVGLAAAIIRKQDPQGMMVVLPADHIIVRETEWLALVEQGGGLAEKGECLVTLGITPTYPETGYGYIEAGPKAAAREGANVFPVIRFHEKPDLEKAREYLESGRFYWNSGMFIWRADRILSWIDRLIPELSHGLDRLVPDIGRPGFAEAMAEVYPTLSPVSIDHGIMEKAEDIYVIPADIGWSDVGSWTAAANHWPDFEGIAAKGQVLSIDSAGCVVYNPSKHVTLIGVRDLIVVETEDATLICHKDRDQEVKQAVEILKKRGREDLL